MSIGKDGKRREVCRKCGKDWNVSINSKISKSGYICPRCKEKRFKAAVKYILLTVAGVIAFKHLSSVALVERGYRAYGGECLLLMLPFVYYAASDMVKDLKEWTRLLFAEEE